ncbi:MAG: hypothetical protein IE916_08670 [Epsilonproteobacteria bacterium]|nr:hypothetical protein [Campylobacterota bacterium]
MKRLTLLLLCLQQLLFGCAACQLMAPSTEVYVDLKFDRETLNSINVEWVFREEAYLKTIMMQYDEDGSGQLELKELETLKRVMMDYLLKSDIALATKLRYAKDANQEGADLALHFKTSSLRFTGGVLIFSYDLEQKIIVADGSMITFIFEDPNGFFSFGVKDLKVDSKEFSYESNLYLFTASIFFKSNTPTSAVTLIEAQRPENVSAVQSESSESVLLVSESQQSNLLKQSIEKIGKLFKSIKDEANPLTYITLLLFAYLYGVIHALGPGHGKTLVASYFVSNERSYTKALFVSLAIGVVHTFSAFILTLIIYFGINMFLAEFVQDSVYLTTKISALIIISIALYLIYKKYGVYKQMKQKQMHPMENMRFSVTPHVTTCSCASCKIEHDSTDFALIISAGIIPCPGTTTIFIFAISLGLYFAGFLAALVMSLGMSTIIYATALFSVTVRKKSQPHNSKHYLEYGSLLVILLLGVVLLAA